MRYFIERFTLVVNRLILRRAKNRRSSAATTASEGPLVLKMAGFVSVSLGDTASASVVYLSGCTARSINPQAVDLEVDAFNDLVVGRLKKKRV